MKYGDDVSDLEIEPSDLGMLTTLLNVFDKLKFNDYGHVVAKLKLTLPVLGHLEVSYLEREGSVRVSNGNHCLLSYNVDENPTDRAQFVGDVKRRLIEEISQTLV